MFREISRVLMPGASAAFVIGNATLDRLEYTTTEKMSELAEEAELEREREILKIVFQLYNPHFHSEVQHLPGRWCSPELGGSIASCGVRAAPFEARA